MIMNIFYDNKNNLVWNYNTKMNSLKQEMKI